MAPTHTRPRQHPSTPPPQPLAVKHLPMHTHSAPVLANNNNNNNSSVLLGQVDLAPRKKYIQRLSSPRQTSAKHSLHKGDRGNLSLPSENSLRNNHLYPTSSKPITCGFKTTIPRPALTRATHTCRPASTLTPNPSRWYVLLLLRRSGTE